MGGAANAVVSTDQVFATVSKVTLMTIRSFDTNGDGDTSDEGEVPLVLSTGRQ